MNTETAIREATTLLIIDNDTQVTHALQLYFSAKGYRVFCAQGGMAGLHLLYAERPDAVILDIMMPGIDGRQVCERIREISDVPILMLSARSHESERVICLELGADDFVPKPANSRELQARIDALLRRARPASSRYDQVAFADSKLVVDVERWEVRLRGELICLTPTEMRVLVFLINNANCVVTHEQMLEHIWGSRRKSASHYVKSFVWRIRRKLEDNPRRPKYIMTERGVGYKFQTNV